MNSNKKIKDVVLLAPNTVKAGTYVDNNVDDGILGAAIRETQEIHLQSIIGSNLLYRLKELVFNEIEQYTDSIEDDENECYKALLDDYILPFMEAKVQAVLPLMLSYRTRNMGVINPSDTNLNAPGMQDVLAVQSKFNRVSDRYATLLSKYLCANIKCFPELTQGDCGCKPYVAPQIGKTFVHQGLWLGGGNKPCCG